MTSIDRKGPIYGGYKVLAFVKGERKVSFVEAWRALESNGVRTYAV
jgi:hypothetical protein